MVSIPPHSSHRLQPLDVTFFGPLKKAYHKECDISMKVNAQRIFRPDDFADLFNRAYSHVAKIAKGVLGFKDTGIMPLGTDIFTNEDLAFEIETGNLTTVPQASSSQQVETNIEKATVSTPPKNDTADSMANTYTYIQNSLAVSFESISPACESEISEHYCQSTTKENKCGHHVKNNTNKKIQKELEKGAYFKCDNIDEKDICDDAVSDEVSVFDEEKCFVCGEFGIENEMCGSLQFALQPEVGLWRRSADSRLRASLDIQASD
ncbi:hypothetical protein PR048_015116 [Dryococelus australis]|uniref:DDE-1 domain-containing protein n=1 Tax=Dryococelus australis TaxID=614101 RepID=A0ABQ9HG25_9NEOP|nr:hypothetical protein PR048_015116 [Dryococelus australis]